VERERVEQLVFPEPPDRAMAAVPEAPAVLQVVQAVRLVSVAKTAVRGRQRAPVARGVKVRERRAARPGAAVRVERPAPHPLRKTTAVAAAVWRAALTEQVRRSDCSA